MAVRAFNVVQYGLESTAAFGTAVASTGIWLGTCTIPRDIVPVYPEYNLQVRARSQKGMKYQQFADGITLAIDDTYWRALPLAFSISVKGEVTPVEQTSSEGDYLWDFSPGFASTDDNLQRAISLEVGDEQNRYKMDYVMARRVTFGGATGQNSAVSLSLDCFGQAVTPMASSDFVTGLTIPTVHEVAANRSQIYFNTASSDIGTTEFTQFIRDYEVEIITGLHEKFLGGGLTFSKHGASYFDAMLRLTVEGDTNADQLYRWQQAQTDLAVRLLITGDVIAGGVARKLTFDLYGTVEEVIPMASENNGNNLYTAVIHGLYNTTAARMFSLSTIVDLAAL